MKVSELTGAKLAQWVALALGYTVEKDGDYPNAPLVVYTPDGDVHSFSDTLGWRPDIQWDRGGPIIEQERICIAGTNASDSLDSLYHGFSDYVISGDTSLQAAMRCVVAKKYGKEVPDA